ncbi:hypothetical protein YC2023_018339 [Brassica napus]
MCDKQVISLVETMKSVFFQICSSRRLPGKSYGCTRLAWKSSGQWRDDLHGSRPLDKLHESHP